MRCGHCTVRCGVQRLTAGGLMLAGKSVRDKVERERERGRDKEETECVDIEFCCRLPLEAQLKSAHVTWKIRV